MCLLPARWKCVAFCLGLRKIAGLNVPFNTEGMEIRDILGRPRKSGTALELSSSPLMISCKKNDAAAILKEFERALDACVPISVDINTPDIETLRLALRNNNDKPISGNLTVKFDGEESCAKIELEAMASSSSILKLSKGIPLKKGVAELWFTGASGTKKLIKTERLPDYIVCRPVGSENSATVMELSAAQVTPPDPIVGWKGPDDCSASAWLEWDSLRLIFYVKVKDDKHCNAAKEPANLWRGDSIQFAFDTLNDAEPQSLCYDANDYEYGIALNSVNGEIMRYCWFAPPGSDKTKLAASLDAEVKRNGTFTNYKVSIPWSSLKPFYPAAGKIMGFSFIVNDNDGEDTRNYYLALTPGVSEKYPGRFGKMVLKGK